MPLVMRGLTEALREDPCFRVLATRLRGSGLERVVEAHSPAVVVLGETADQSVIAGIQAAPTRPTVLFLTDDPSALLRSWLTAVEVTQLPWHISLSDFVEAVHRAAKGAGSRAVHRQTPAPRDHERRPQLTARELEVFNGIASGETDAAIAKTLGVSVSTVKTHSGNIRRKFNVKSRRELLGKNLRDAGQHKRTRQQEPP